MSKRADGRSNNKPPLSTKFKPGNQFGRRPRKPKPPNPYEDFQKVLRRKVTMSVGGVRQKVTIRKALLLRLREEAQKGVKWALRLAQKLIELAPPPSQYAQAERDQAELESIIYDLKMADLRKRLMHTS